MQYDGWENHQVRIVAVGQKDMCQPFSLAPARWFLRVTHAVS